MLSCLFLDDTLVDLIFFFQARGGSISFVKGDISLDVDANNSRDKKTMLLVYVNGSHEYVIFDPRKSEKLVITRNTQKKIQAEESGECVICVITLSTSSPLLLRSLLATVSQMIYVIKELDISIVTCLMSCLSEAVTRKHIICNLGKMDIFSHFLSTLKHPVETLKPSVCCFSTNRLCFYLRRASKTGVKERGFRCSIYPFRQILGDNIQWIVSCSSASHEAMLRFLVITAREETSGKRLRQAPMYCHIIQYLPVTKWHCRRKSTDADTTGD